MIDFHNTLPPEPDKVTLTTRAHNKVRNHGDPRVAHHSLGLDIGSIVSANLGEFEAGEFTRLSDVGSALADQIEDQHYRKHFSAGYLEAVGLVVHATLQEALEQGARL